MKLLQSEPIAAATLTTIGIWKTTTILFGFNLPYFQRMFIKRRLDAWGGRISYNAVYNDLHILWEKQIYERTAHCWKRNMYQVTSPTHLKVSKTIFWDVLASFDFCLTSVCLCQIFQKANFIEPMQSNEYKSQPTNRRATANTDVLVATINAQWIRQTIVALLMISNLQLETQGP